MTQLHVEAEGLDRAAPESVWALIADANTYSQWGPWSASGYERPGDESEHGVGAVRWFRYRRTTSVARVLEIEEGRDAVYTVVRGMPVRNYRAEVSVMPTPVGTRIRWAAAWDTTLVGRIVRHKLRTVYPDVVAHLVAAGDKSVLAR